jgi:hypothetical protein
MHGKRQRLSWARLARGQDPATERKAKAEAARTTAERDKLTLAALVVDWQCLHLCGRKPRYASEAVRALQTAFETFLGAPCGRTGSAISGACAGSSPDLDGGADSGRWAGLLRVGHEAGNHGRQSL